MKIAISGSHGLIGSAIIDSLKNDHEIIPLEHRNQKFYFKNIPFSNLQDIDIMIHLAGEPISGRWSEEKKQKIKESRIDGTHNLSQNLAHLIKKPSLFICASAIGYYGNRNHELLTEASIKGKGFLSDVCAEWEEATRPAVEAGIRTINLRFGMVLDKNGGALKKMLTPFKLGLGGAFGSGQQYVSWIALKDLVRIFHFLMDHQLLSGPINAVSPEPVTNRDLTKVLGAVLKRPTFLSMPDFLVNWIFGEMGQELLLNSQKVMPEKLLKAGFKFDYPNLESTLKDILN